MPNPGLNNVLPSGPINPISNHTSCHSAHFDYQLCGGKMYLRTRTPDAPKMLFRGDLISTQDNPDALEWQLFDNIGVPYNDEMESLLAPDEHLVELDVASDIVVAVSNLNRIYLYKPTENNRPLTWTSLLGAPDMFQDKLYLPSYRRAWAFSCSVCRKPEVRTTDFMNPQDIVTFFSDANGVRFDFGFTPTIYVLDGDGLKIVYWDTGLPASFSRGFLVPDGQQGQSLSAAGSTVFLSTVDANGSLHFFTRMIDYEINGACPGLAVSYDDIPIVYPPDGPEGHFFLGSGVRKMPLAGWLEHPVDEILPYLTDNVCIRLIGQGDNARELRIQGHDPKLGWGYYSKQITDTDWTFHPEPAITPSEQIHYPFNPKWGATQKLSYSGYISDKKLLPYPHTKHDTSGVVIELEDFHPFLSDAEPFYLTIGYHDDIERIRIHAVDAWGLHYHQHHDDELIGTIDGEPKALMGTLILTPSQIALTQNKASKLGMFLKQYFLSSHQQTKQISIIADNSMAILKCNHVTCHFKRLLSEEEKDHSFYMRMVTTKKLAAIPESMQECADLLTDNKNCLKKIKSIFFKRRLHDGKDALLNINLSAIRPFAAGFFNMTQPDDPTYQQAVNDINLLFKVHRRATAWSAKQKGETPGYQQALAILNERIDYLESVLVSFDYSIKTGV